MARVFSGIQPTGDVHLGNYIGAIARWAANQQPEHFYCIVDLHGITAPGASPHADATLELASWLFAAGLDPELSTLFVQSQVHEHAELSWILECVATMGELGRMTQFKDKAAGRDSVPVGLFTYPVLQAADILLYHAEEVPVGEDQRQHIELTRDVAQRFNQRYGETFTVPKATFPTSGARIMDLSDPLRKMSKTSPTPAGTIYLAEDEKTTRRKVLRAVTDSGSEVRAGEDKQGVTNLLDLMAAVTGGSVGELENAYTGKGYGDFKKDVAEAVNGFLRPVRARYAELQADQGAVVDALVTGADRAGEVAAATLGQVKERMGFLRRP